MKELSIYVDESDDFGEYAQHSPYYIVTMILHDQDTYGVKSNKYSGIVGNQVVLDDLFET